MQSAPILRTDKLLKMRGGRAVVSGLDLEVQAGEIVGLLGPHGAGKSTALAMIAGLVRPSGGHVFLNGAEVRARRFWSQVHLGMGYMPEEESNFRKLTVAQNLQAILEVQPLSREDRRARCAELLAEFGLEHVTRQHASTLADVEKRLLSLARAFAGHPKLLLLYEPFSGLDSTGAAEVRRHIVELRRREVAIVIADHRVREALDIVDRAYLFFEGKVVSHGTKDFLTRAP